MRTPAGDATFRLLAKAGHDLAQLKDVLDLPRVKNEIRVILRQNGRWFAGGRDLATMMKAPPGSGDA